MTSAREQPTVPPTNRTAGMDSPVADALPPAQIGTYQRGRELGRGGMGVVYQATDTRTGRKVALKLLGALMASDTSAVNRFIQEAKLAAQISHPRTTFVYEAGEHEGRPYIVMELMPGRTLADLLDEEGPLPVRQAVDLVLDVIDGLIAAHQLNVVHRDVKPSNCFLDVDGRVKIGDFGLSKNLVTDVSLTSIGTFMGTPQYAAPEQVRGAATDQRTDVYSVGATLFSLIAGRPPFEGDDAMSVTAQIVSDPSPSLRTIVDRVPRGLDRVVAKSLSKDPADRFSDLEKMRQALHPFGSGGTALAEVARRAAAYMIDYLLISTLTVSAAAMALAMRNLFVESEGNLTLQVWKILHLFGVANWIILVLYFALAEGFRGITIGKRLLGLGVVDREGENPGFARALIRALVIPGAFGIPLIGLMLRFNLDESVDEITISSVMRLWGLSKLTEILPALICILTMRRRNGLRGIHEILSGTRVLKMASEQGQSVWDDEDLQQEFAPRTWDDPEFITAYQIEGRLAEYGATRVDLGHDKKLKRRAWIFRTPAGDSSPLNPLGVNRHGRARYLQSGTSGSDVWHAFEAVEGVNLAQAAKLDGKFTWENTRRAVLDFVRELAASLHDGSLPANLAFEQFWIDRNGAGKLLELPLGLPENPDVAATHLTPEQRAAQAINRIFELVNDKQILPVSIQSKFKAFAARPPTADAVSILAEQLDEADRQIGYLKWDTRIGVLGVVVGSELVAGVLISFVALWFYYRAVGFFPAWKIILPISVLSLIMFGIGFSMRGAPVFRFMGIDVRNKDGGVASAWQCGLRHWIAWLPAVVFIVVFILLALMTIEVSWYPEIVNGEGDPSQSAIIRDLGENIDDNKTFFFGIFAVMTLTLIVMYLGIVYSVLRPERGIPDRLAGTRLVPK